MLPDFIDFEEVNGKRDKKDITVYALSTCGFCRRGLAFLRDNKIKFRYVYIDKLPRTTKEKLKRWLKEHYNKRLVYPFVVVNGEKVILGYIPEQWKKELKK